MAEIQAKVTDDVVEVVPPPGSSPGKKLRFSVADDVAVLKEISFHERPNHPVAPRQA
jgi:hypothetical protein